MEWTKDIDCQGFLLTYDTRWHSQLIQAFNSFVGFRVPGFPIDM